MDKDDEYRRNAAEAQGWADKAKNDADRAAWLRVVQGWLNLIKGSRTPQQVADDSFEDRNRSDGTGQKRSDQSH